jgi:glycoside/pentoside/hexuronide:cation symporter, GPH family
MMVYSANNLPYSALTGVITGDIAERSSLSQYRFVFAMMAAFVVQGLSPLMVRHFGQGNNAKGYQITMGILSALAVGCFLVTFFTIRERIRPDPAQKSNIRQDFADLGKNGPWIALFVLTVLVLVSYTIRAGVMVYYFKYYVGREDLFSIFNVCGLAACVTGIVLSKPLSLRYGKREVYGVGLFLTVVFQSLFIALPPTPGPAIAFEALRQLCYGCTIPLMWTMMADVADYSEWKTGRRATGMVYSGVVFGLKFGLGVGGAVAGWVLALYGYVPNAAQSAHALTGIRMTASVFGAIPFFLAIFCLFFYKIDTKLNIQIAKELAERRLKFANTAIVN